MRPDTGILPGMPCGHCGFTGDLSEKSFATIKTVEYVSPDGFTDYQWYIHARVMQCPGCEGLIFYTYREWHYEDPADWPVTILYPQPPDVRGLPEKVREFYEKALPTKASDPTSFVVGIGNILEAICAEQGISSNKTLQRKLQDLAAKFPDTLADMTHHLRKLRNRGAHGDMVEASDAKIAADFVESILDHLYRNPAKLRRVTYPEYGST